MRTVGLDDFVPEGAHDHSPRFADRRPGATIMARSANVSAGTLRVHPSYSAGSTANVAETSGPTTDGT